MVTIQRDHECIRSALADPSTGINCMEFPSAMYWDKRTDGDSPEALEVAEARRRVAGCQVNSRCTKPPYEEKKAWECDEFPLKTTDRNRMMHRDTLPINRCVPLKQSTGQSSHNLPQLKLCVSTNMMASGKLNLLQDFYKSREDYGKSGGLHDQEGWFKLAFQNFAGIEYCEDASKKCVHGILARGISCSHHAMALLM